MIKTPVSYDDSDNVLYQYPQVEDASGSFIFECKDKKVAKEIVKRINMHDKLVAALDYVRRVMVLPENIEIEIDNILERYK